MRTTPNEAPTRLTTAVDHLVAWSWPGAEGEDTPVAIAVHDLASNGLWYADLASALDPTIRLATWDRRGRSGSYPLGHTASLDAAVHDLWTVAATLGASTFQVIAHGTGAAIALDAAYRFRDRVTAVTLLDGPPVVTDSSAATATRVDPLAADVGRTHAHRDDQLRRGATAELLRSGGLSRNARRAALAPVAGSGFGWRVRIDPDALTRELAELVTWRIPSFDALPPVMLWRAAHGPATDQPPVPLIANDLPHVECATTHLGLITDRAALAQIAETVAERSVAT